MKDLPARKIRSVLNDIRIRQDVLYPNLAELVLRYGATQVGLSGKELRVFSQNGEDGVIAEIFRRIGTTNRVFIEFGIGPGIQGNCVFLADILGWSGLFMEADPRMFDLLQDKYQGNDVIATRNVLISTDNINHILSSEKIGPCPDLMSIDIDGNDYWIWTAINAVHPRVVVIEYNGSLDTRRKLVQPYQPFHGWDTSDFFGASLEAMVELGRSKGYTFVHTDLTGTNAFFVAKEYSEYFADITPPPRRRANYSLQGARHVGSHEAGVYISPPTTSGLNEQA